MRLRPMAITLGLALWAPGFSVAADDGEIRRAGFDLDGNIAWLDLDGDGLKDAVRFGGGYQAQVLLGTESGFEVWEGGLSWLTSPLRAVASLEMGGDEAPAVVLATDAATWIARLEAGEPELLGRLPGARQVEVVDFDSDGVLDLALGADVYRQVEGWRFEPVDLPVRTPRWDASDLAAGAYPGSTARHGVEAAVPGVGAAGVPSHAEPGHDSPGLEARKLRPDEPVGTSVEPVAPISSQGVDGDLVVGGTIQAHGSDASSFAGEVITAGPWIDVRAFGAVGDGVADDTGALQAAIDFAGEARGGTVLIPNGTYRTTEAIVIGRSSITLHGIAAIILVDHDGVGLDVDPEFHHVADLKFAGGFTVQKKDPDVEKGGSIGIRFRNSYGGNFSGFSVRYFDQGIYMTANDLAGCAYNMFQPDLMWQNRIQLTITNGEDGYSNQNTFIGGRWSMTGFDDAVFIRILAGEKEPGVFYRQNGNHFLHLSTESAAPTRVVECDGIFNTFIDFRSEVGDMEWYFSPGSYGNTVFMGTYLQAAYVMDASRGQNKIMVHDGSATHLSTDLHLGPRILNTWPDAYPDRHVVVRSDDDSSSVGVALAISDPESGGRAQGWLEMDLAARKMELSHFWYADLDYHLAKDRLVIKQSGNVGIGNTEPERALHVNDVMRLEPRAGTPPGPYKEGDLYVNSTDHRIYCFLDGTWKPLD